MVTEIIILAILVFLSGIFSGSETALTSVNRFKIKFYVTKKKFGAASLSKLRENPHRMLSTLLICNNVVNVSASVIATDLSLKIFSSNALAFATGIMTFLILVFGEIVPKNVATTYSGGIALIMSPVVRVLSVILWPLIVIFDFITQKVFRIKEPHHKMTEEEVRNIVDMAKDEGAIDKEEKELIHRIFKFDDTSVYEVMTPRTDMISLKKTSTLKEVLEIIKKNNHSRFPVYEDERDNVVGIFYFKDAFDYIIKKKYDIQIGKLMRTPYVVPETKKIDNLLKVLQKKKQQMAIVVDEHGGVSGLLTMEDILEEIVGDIADETEKVEQEIKKIDKKSYRVLGKTDLAEVNKKLKTRFKDDNEYDTFSGYVLHKLGRIPKEGEEIDLRSATIKIKKVDAHRILEVVVKKK